MLSNSQQLALDHALKGRSLLVTGPGGTGKSHLVSSIVQGLRSQGKVVAKTGSTGIAAVNIGGSTIHSLLKTGICGSVDELKKAMSRGDVGERRDLVERIRALDTLIVDEVSMLSGDYLDMMDFRLRMVRGSPAPFGGVQVVWCGDFLQLPAVSTRDKPLQKTFAFQADSWKELAPRIVMLTKTFRQEDQEFVDHLLRVRRGDVYEETEDFFMPCHGRRLVDPVRLFPLNEDVARVNAEGLRTLTTREVSYRARYSGKDASVEMLRKNCIAEDVLVLKEGAPVLCIRNTESYVNGTRARVLRAFPEAVDVELETGSRVRIDRESWELQDEKGVMIASMEQIPLKLAWAISIHKSQGTSLSSVEVDLRRCFERGQAYVALSRARKLEGLSLLSPLTAGVVKTSHEAVAFYDRLVERRSAA